MRVVFPEILFGSFVPLASIQDPREKKRIFSIVLYIKVLKCMSVRISASISLSLGPVVIQNSKKRSVKGFLKTICNRYGPGLTKLVLIFLS